MELGILSMLFIILTLYLIYIVLQMVVGIYLFIRMRKTKLNNILPLSLFFIISSIQGIMSLFNLPVIIFQASLFIPSILLLIFTKLTFFRDQKTPFIFFLVIMLILKIITFLVSLFIIPLSTPMTAKFSKDYVLYYYLYLLIICINLSIPELWLGYSALNYYKQVKLLNIEPWIKKRYLIISYSAIILFIEAIAYLFLPWSSEGFRHPQALVVIFIVTTVTVVFSIGSIIGWMMPKKLKIHFNKGFTPIRDEILDEAELLKKIKSELSKGG